MRINKIFLVIDDGFAANNHLIFELLPIFFAKSVKIYIQPSIVVLVFIL